MAVVSGKDGLVAWTNVDLVSNAYAWSLEIEADVFDGTVFGDGWKDVVTGTISWRGTISCRLDDTVNMDWVATSAALTLTLDSGNTYSGTAWLTRTSANVEVVGEALATYEFVGDGELTIGTLTPTPSPEI